MTRERVTAGVIARDGRIFICQRRPTDRHPGKWEFPGGKIEPGETSAACVRRELREELGIEATPGRELWRTQHDYDKLRVEIVFVAIEHVEGEARNLIFADTRWAAVDELESYDFLEGDRDFVARLVRGDIRL